MATQKKRQSKLNNSVSKKNSKSSRKNPKSELLFDNGCFKENKNRKDKPKRSNFLTALMIIALVFGGGGYFTFAMLTKNDQFSIIGEQRVTLIVGEEYEEMGAKLISFGKDKSAEIVIEGEVDTSTTGKYFIKYSSKDYRFKNVVRYRYIIVEEAGV